MSSRSREIIIPLDLGGGEATPGILCTFLAPPVHEGYGKTVGDR